MQALWSVRSKSVRNGLTLTRNRTISLPDLENATWKCEWRTNVSSHAVRLTLGLDKHHNIQVWIDELTPYKVSLHVEERKNCFGKPPISEGQFTGRQDGLRKVVDCQRPSAWHRYATYIFLEKYTPGITHRFSFISRLAFAETVITSERRISSTSSNCIKRWVIGDRRNRSSTLSSLDCYMKRTDSEKPLPMHESVPTQNPSSPQTKVSEPPTYPVRHLERSELSKYLW